MTVGTVYYFQVDRALYLPTTQMFETAGSPPVVAPTDWAHLKLLNTLVTTSLANVVLLGGDATNDNIINVNDATCIGGGYNKPPATCGSVGNSSDVNEDGVVDILDLVLMGGNYDKTASTWTP